MMLVKYVVNVINEGVHESEYLVLYDVLEQGTHRRILALNEHHKQKLQNAAKQAARTSKQQVEDQ